VSITVVALYSRKTIKMLVVGGGGGHFTEVWSGGKPAPIPNLTVCFTEANFISVYMGLYPVPRSSFFSQLAGKEK
jgi:hypothetical protein